ncbi:MULTISPECIES: hypothetical protein [Curtobacterium]|jgi:hypothetical protein|uniref:Uncharacterized protein n=2 Tax=Curtobacterium TaxID=2034 RepID=A0A9Q2ZJU7_9MICO|nr:MULTISPECIES: hypothetical protein [Curtobacterium]MBF4596127.1 hypothetical protein [Curtobacterium sp. VKM Ac-1796]MBF4611243.1 hypothetical protein [Curtobacterium sp. VKM Ac-2889]MBF4612967.1 hypothetical protein [Curtobacterium sp. VKM Ac-1376]MBF4628238.1 hypothetical protein [Curtobacterium flaccumfaciens]MBO9042025.1 hypothetical protein [Curtobacterium flaccumfaciens pv. flaccumfaciens]
MSAYTSDENVEPARITTFKRVRKQWRRTGEVGYTHSGSDFFRDDAPEAVQR